MGKANQGYKREKAVALNHNLRPVPFSGSRFEHGREDAESDNHLAQIKSSKARLTIRTNEMWGLYCRAVNQGKMPIILFDGLASENFPEQTWIAFPVNYIEDVVRDPDLLAVLAVRKKREKDE